MRIHILAILLFTILLFPIRAFCQNKEFTSDTLDIETYYHKQFEALNKNGAVPSDADMASLTYNKAQAYGSLLNKYYKKLSALLNEEERKTLIQAQRSWMAFRDSEDILLLTTSLITNSFFRGGMPPHRLG